MTLRDLIKKHGWNAKTAAEVQLLANTPVLVENPHGWTCGELYVVLGPENCNAVLNAIRQAGESQPLFASAFIALSTKDGMSLHQPERQVMIDSIPGISAEIKAIVKALGQRPSSLWKESGGESDVTLTEAEAAVLSVRTGDRITNAAALAGERMLSMPESDHASAWSQCWEDAAQ